MKLLWLGNLTSLRRILLSSEKYIVYGVLLFRKKNTGLCCKKYSNETTSIAFGILNLVMTAEMYFLEFLLICRKIMRGLCRV